MNGTIDLYAEGVRRRPITRPTSIYWLIDSRTNEPFYCGKTVLPLHQRLANHKYEAAHGDRAVHRRVRACGEQFSIHLVETVPAGGDWGEREKRWIYVLRQAFDNVCNTADGGAGTPGRVVSPETRAKIIKANTGRKHSPETRAKISQFLTGRKWKPESIAKMRATKLGYVFTPEHRAAISTAKKGKPGQPHTDERRAKISKANKGKKRTEATRQRMRESVNSGRFAAR